MLRLTGSRVAVGGAALLVALATGAPAAATLPATLPAGPTRPARQPSGPDFEAASRAEQAAIDAVTTARRGREAAETDVRRLDGELAQLSVRSAAAAGDLQRLDAARRNV